MFKNKVIWITGASSGIGEALAHTLASKGSILVLSARREAELKRVALATGLGDDRILLLPFDLSDTSTAETLADQVIKRFGRIDILINNGGFSQRSAALETDPVTERQIMEVNYFAHVALSKAVLPHMIKNRSGQIVVISSIAGKFGFYLRSSYSAAKHALHGYFESLRLETERYGIKILMVCPGKIRTSVSLNAVVGKGRTHQQMDPSHENAMCAEDCAAEIVSAIKKKKQEVYIGGKEILMVYFKRWMPGLFNRLIRKQSPF